MKYIIIFFLLTNTAYAQTPGTIGVLGTRSHTEPIPPTPSGTIYVDGSNSGSEDGSSAHPWSTIQEAADVAHDDDIVIVRAGVYRETVVPAHSGTSGHPITFQFESGAIVSGLNLVGDTGWTIDHGSVYKKTWSAGPLFTERQTGFSPESLQSNNTQMLSQQIFKNSIAQPLAGYPKVTGVEKYLEHSSFRSKNQASIGIASVTDAGLGTFGNITGAIVSLQGWFILATRTVTSSSGNTINFSSIYDPKFNWFYRVAGHLNLLTQAGEWYYNGSTLYYWQVGNGSPTGLEYKARNWGFDLRNVTNITIKGGEFIGCDPVMTELSSVNVTIDGIKANYTSHHLLETQGGAGDGTGYMVSNVQTGTKLLGQGSVLQNSEFRYASGVTVWGGSNVTIQNNYFENGGYGGFYPGFIKPYFSNVTGTNNLKILYNTFVRSGRGDVELTANNSNCTHTNMEIAYNDFSKFNMICVDGGAVYGARKSILANSMVHHNYIHSDGGFDEAGTGQQYGIQVNGVYFDQASGPIVLAYNVHENTVSGVGRSGAYSSDFYTQAWWNEVNVYATGINYIYNNTMSTNSGGGQYSYVTYQNTLKDKQRNGIYAAGIVTAWAPGGDVSNSVTQGTNPRFTGVGTGIAKFQLQSTSPARGIGTTSIPGLPSGAPTPSTDAGAICYGCSPFRVGYLAIP